jgi:RNA polymerase sigma-70 factor (ECF subfamily)
MEPQEENDRLSGISTRWSMLEQAHAGGKEGHADPWRALIQRYHGAAYRYLLAAVRDEEAAADLFQEFALRFLRGDFSGANPKKGRFRDYLKTSLIHLVTDYHRQRKAQPGSLPVDVADPSAPAGPDSDDADFTRSWREELLNRTWQSLLEDHPAQHATLLFHVQNPTATSADAAAALSGEWGKEATAGAVRVTLHRARHRFAELLLREVAHSMEDPGQGDLERELRELGLFKLCGDALLRRGPS